MVIFVSSAAISGIIRILSSLTFYQAFPMNPASRHTRKNHLLVSPPAPRTNDFAVFFACASPIPYRFFVDIVRRIGDNAGGGGMSFF